MTFASTITTVMTSVAAEVAGVVWSVGAREGDAHVAPPSVRWIPERDRYGAAPKRAVTADHLTRTIAGVDTTFRVVCWGESYTQAATLRDAVLRGCHAAAPAFASGEAGRWVDTGVMTAGEAVEITITFNGFVPDTSPTLATVDTIDTTFTGIIT